MLCPVAQCGTVLPAYKRGRAIYGAETLWILLLAAVLEVGGDALVREALARWEAGWIVLAPMVLVSGMAALGIYAVLINKAPLPFGTTLGLYVAFFGVSGVIAGALRDWRVDCWNIAGVVIITMGGLVINHGERIRAAASQAG